MRSRADPGTPDSSRLLEATARLVTSDEWRQRVVEKVQPLSADHYELRRSFQFEVPQGLVTDLTDDAQLDCLLPVCWLPKTALLDFDIVDDEGKPLPALERISNAGAISQILDSWLDEITDDRVPGMSQRRLEIACAASLAPWSEHRTNAKNDAEALEQYLGEALTFIIPHRHVQMLLATGQELAAEGYRLIGRQSTTEDRDNTFASAALLLPYLDTTPKNLDELLTVTSQHHDTVREILELAETSGDVAEWLTLALEAGIRWPLLVRAIIPIDAPFTVKVKEVRPSGDKNPRVLDHRADLSWIRSFHLHVRAPDSSTLITRPPEAELPSGEKVGTPGFFEAARMTQELFSVYTSHYDAPGSVRFRIRFGLRSAAWLPYVYALLMACAAILVALAQPVAASLATVLVVPTTLVSAILVTRDAPLVAQFLRWPRLILVVLSIGLWGIRASQTRSMVGCEGRETWRRTPRAAIAKVR